jgi:Uma2 family endonuclease
MDVGTSEGPAVRRFTADEAIRMVEAGILGEDEHLELLDGALVEMSPQGPRHGYVLRRLPERLRGAYPGPWTVQIQLPLAIDRFNLPEPDLAIVGGAPETYADRHPAAAEAALVIEVAVSSQREDRRKADVYARGGVPIYWIIDLAGRRLEVRAAPEGGAYQVTRILGEDEVVELPQSDARWTVRDILG